MSGPGPSGSCAGTVMVEQGGNLVASDERFEIHAEHVVTATGNHAQRTAKLLNIKMPAIPVEHQFIVTDVDPELAGLAGGREPGTSGDP